VTKQPPLKTSDTDWASSVGMLVSLSITLPIFGWLGFKLLDFDFFRPFGYLLLSFAFGIPAAFVVLLVWAFMHSSKALTRNQELVKSSHSKIAYIVDEHLDSLAHRRIALVSKDRYGVVKAGGWNREIQYFVDKVVRPQLSAEEAKIVGENMNTTFQTLIDDRVAKRSDEIELSLDFDSSMSPIAFERWCAKIMEDNGWSARITSASGDQGADVIAHKGSMSILLQCKLYSSPVGNKAIQEAFTAQRHYGTLKAAVVTNAGFTRSAQELAATTKVMLLHHSELDRLSV
jgi:restriction system protein